MNEYDIRVGSVVLSTQGRDKGMYFLVVSVGKGFVFLADGGMRKLNAPKKKNVKHVSFSGVVLEAIAEKLTTGKKVFDSEVKSALRQFNQQNK
ncbi:MAG: KOW domain-containing RNA-binding protein [Clostridia bacterium]|nr:KOW domain-containing RNA-binding protein [Clostridia bacterium]MBQ8504639.1 KOW domain-containing RNA-binding protein [Clostridia bacterium]MBQ8772788.1 KOW domain-containing RNA-binding protein [Clostridia bacterium]MBQ8872710.1 KOW domain-containing RNA-binding protein [Clostridia bacterium]MBQ9706892.1 KOW domain-containing RNA-binding protein [Clostridia bacterium]